MSKRIAFSLFAVAAATLSCVNPISSSASEPKPRPHMDIAFCIDTTGSMQGEIDMVKTKVKEVVAKLASGTPAPEVRVGLVAYRDRGDQYVTKIFPFSDDIDKVVKDISALKADGGGDTPEAVNEGLHAAVHDLHWDNNKKTAKLLFLIGDAGPHIYANDYDWRDECTQAIGSGIQINTIACSGLESDSRWVDMWKEIAKRTDGKFDTLAYRQEVVDAGGHSRSIVTTGGAAYTVADKKGSWKEAVSHGKLTAMDDRPVASAERLRGYSAGAAGGRAPASPMAAPMSMAEVGFAGAAAGSRRDNNLDDIMLNTAKAQAQAKLKIEYKP